MSQWTLILPYLLFVFVIDCVIAFVIYILAKLFKQSFSGRIFWGIVIALFTIELLIYSGSVIFFSIRSSQSCEQRPLPQYDTTNLRKTSEMLEESRYWQVIEGALQNNGSDQEQLLAKELGKLSPDELIRFQIRTMKFLHDTYTSEMWCAGYIMNSGCSDDGFEYFRYWVISRGKVTFYNAKGNPDNLFDAITGHRTVYEYEPLINLPFDVFKRMTGAELYNYIDYDSIYKKRDTHKEIKFNWKEDDPESMRKICPRLFDKF